ncbi:MAG: hypothetical protein ACJ70O_06885 [Nitrososphaera sp.]
MLSGISVTRGKLLRNAGNTRRSVLVLRAVFAPSHAFSPTTASAEALQASYKLLDLQIYTEARFGFSTVMGYYYYHK